ncbi:hypothetical protein EON64_18520 [archaeon]|nr:MAG: hypothetical protein EON64_18520 [archaeon]
MKIAIYSHSIAPSIDGVCRRFTGILNELESSGEHQTLLFTLESQPEDVPKNTRVVTLDHMFFPAYPEKKVARPSWRSLMAIFQELRDFQPDVSYSHQCCTQHC